MWWNGPISDNSGDATPTQSHRAERHGSRKDRKGRGLGYGADIKRLAGSVTLSEVKTDAGSA